MNSFLKRFLQGLLLGFALITAIGGGTMAVLIGVYDEIIDSVADFRKDPKKSLRILIPMGLGGLISMGALFYPIKLLLEHFPFITISFFAGLTLGGLRTFHSSLKGSFNWQNLIFTIVGFLFVFGLGAFSYFSKMQGDLLNIDMLQIAMLFFVGFISMGGHVSPGISGTFILIAFGYYEELINFLMRLVKFDFISVGYDLGAAFAFVIASLLGLIVIAKVYKYFLAKNRTKTNFTILGFIFGSVTIAYFNGKIKAEYEALAGFDPLIFIGSIIALLAGALIAYFLLGLVNKKEQAVTTTLKEMKEEENDDVTLGI